MKHINETPDYLFYKGRELTILDKNMYCFGYYQNNFKIVLGTTHFHLFRVDREHQQYPGRLWLNDKVITFWYYPKNKVKLRNIIFDIENKLRIDIWNDNEWRVEVFEGDDYPRNKFIKLQDYVGSSDIGLCDIDYNMRIQKQKSNKKTYQFESVGQDKEFKNPKELLDFVLVECGDMCYYFEQAKDNYLNQNNIVLAINNPISGNPGFNIERIYYAWILLFRKFQISIIALDFSDLDLEDSDFYGDFLSKINCEMINLLDNKLTKIPNFYPGIERIIIDEDVDYNSYPNFYEYDEDEKSEQSGYFGDIGMIHGTAVATDFDTDFFSIYGTEREF